MYYFLKVLLWLPLTILFPTRFCKKNIPKGKVIFVSNHRTNFDVILLHHLFWCKPHILGKKELFDKKSLRPILKMTGTIPVDRKNVELSTIKRCIGLLNENKKLLVFPEGTRSKSDTDELNAIKNGVAMFALKTNSPIVPLWIKKKTRIFRFNKIVVGEPFTLDQFTGKKINHELLTEAGKFIADKMTLLR